jgi:hypothetical protein
LEKNIGVIEKDIKTIIFSKEYLKALRKIGFSKEFILKEQVRRMDECINYLIEVIVELKND